MGARKRLPGVPPVLALAAALALGGVLWALWPGDGRALAPRPGAPEAAETSGESGESGENGLTGRFVRPRDGDSMLLEVDGVRTEVRLIGINCPEKGEPGADEARALNIDWLSRGPVRLELDQDRFDRFDRLLAYVWRDGEMLNEVLVRSGLCPPRYYKPNGRHRARLEAAWKARAASGAGY